MVSKNKTSLGTMERLEKACLAYWKNQTIFDIFTHRS